MGANLKSERQDMASMLASRSALSRRRADAFYRVAADKIKASRIRVAALAVIAVTVAVSIAAIWFARDSPYTRDRAVPLALPTAAHQIDRYFITHPVKHGDTIWKLSKYYYGSSSEINQKRLLDANPEYVKDPDKLTVGTLLKVPLI